MRHLHQCTRHDANVALWPSGRLPAVLRQNDPERGGSAVVAVAMRHLSVSWLHYINNMCPELHIRTQYLYKNQHTPAWKSFHHDQLMTSYR